MTDDKLSNDEVELVLSKMTNYLVNLDSEEIITKSDTSELTVDSNEVFDNITTLSILTYIAARSTNPSSFFNKDFWDKHTNILLDRKLIELREGNVNYNITDDGLLLLQKVNNLFV